VLYAKKPHKKLWAAQACGSSQNRFEKGGFQFSDLPYGHPVYRAWKSLIEVGLNLSDDVGAANPYEDVSWESWKKAVFSLNASYPLNDGGQSAIPVFKKGAMKAYEIEQSLLAIRKNWGLPQTAFRCVVSSPTRMEAFSALGSLLEEMRRFRKR